MALGRMRPRARSSIELITQIYSHCSVRAYLEARHIVRTSSLKVPL
jgi:hypothetical protein